jgi:hypothetical protein
MLHADLREIEAHLAVWPDDKYAIHRHGLILEDIEAATPPMTSDQRQSTLRGAKPVPGSYDWMGKAARDALPAGYENPCLSCKSVVSCSGCVHRVQRQDIKRYGDAPSNDLERYAQRQLELYGNKPKRVILDDVTEQWDFGRTNALRFTFGADYEMDQQWLARERAKVAGRREEQRTVASPTPTAEPDRMMFPVMAYDLTSLHNLNYGTSRY